MKYVAAALAIASVLAALPSTARADDENVHTLPVITIYGRPNRPSVVIELTRPTAARAAAAAHEEMKAALVAKTEPHPFR
jgi:hypothetical protein